MKLMLRPTSFLSVSLFLLLTVLVQPHISQAALVNTSAVGGGTLSSGLIGWWTFDGKNMKSNVADSSGQGNNGAMIGMGATSSVVVSGKIGQALYFNGQTSSVIVPQTAAFHVSTSPFTISFWVRDDTPGGSLSSFHRIMSWYDGTNNIQVGLANGRHYYFVVSSSGTNTGTSTLSVISTGWHHVTVTHDNTNTYAMYVDGSVVSTTIVNNTSIFTANSSNIYIGQRGDNSARLVGNLDDVRIYNRALSATNAKQLYNLGFATKQNITPNTPTNPLQSGLVGWWTFDGKDLKNNVADMSGNGNNGSMIAFGATSTAIVPGKIGQALKFNGTSSRVDAGAGSSLADLPSQGGGGMTAIAWVKPSAGTGLMIMAKGTALSFSATWSISLSSGNRINFIKEADSDMLARAGINSYTTGVWQQIAVEWDGSTTAANVRFYVNGQLKTHDNNTDGVGLHNDSANRFIIGATQNPSGFFRGNIDDVRLYNRMLSQAEIIKLYNDVAATKQNITPNIPTNPLQNGLVGWWTFDGKDMKSNVADVSGTGNNGSLINFSATSTYVVPGKIGQALKFNGLISGPNATRITAGHAASLNDLPLSGGLTVSAWLKPKVSPQLAEIVAKASNASIGWAFSLSTGSGGAMALAVPFSGGNLNVSTSADITAVDTNKWIHVVVTWDGSANASGVKFYKNGVIQSYNITSSTSGSYISDAAKNLAIGDFETGGREFAGAMDDVRVYNRVLSAAEVKRLYNFAK